MIVLVENIWGRSKLRLEVQDLNSWQSGAGTPTQSIAHWELHNFTIAINGLAILCFVPMLRYRIIMYM